MNLLPFIQLLLKWCTFRWFSGFCYQIQYCTKHTCDCSLFYFITMDIWDLKYNLSNATSFPPILPVIWRMELKGDWRWAVKANNYSLQHMASSLLLQYLRPIPLRWHSLLTWPKCIRAPPRTQLNPNCIGSFAHALSGPLNPHSPIEIYFDLKEHLSCWSSVTSRVFLAQI